MKNTHKSEKEKVEWFALKPILQQCNIAKHQVIKQECPDFVILNHKGTQIGVEVTKLATNEKVVSDLEMIFNDYEDYLRKIGENHLHITIVGVGMNAYTEQLRRADLKQVIFEELERHRHLDSIYNSVVEEGNLTLLPYFGILEKQGKFNYRFIEEIHCFTHSSLDTAVFFIPFYMFGSDRGAATAIQDRIEKKNKKLGVYQRRAQNRNINEYWLVVYVPSFEGIALEEIYWSENENNKYARIYVTNDFQEVKRLY